MQWDLPALDIDEAKILMNGEFGIQVHKLALLHMTYFTFGVVKSDGRADIRNATCFFFRTPSRLLVVTARHVIQEYGRVKRLDSDIRCQIGNIAFSPEDRLIALGEKADIATLAVTDEELKKLKKCPITLWPPSPPDGNDRGILLAGYPAKEVRMYGPRTGSFGIYTASGIAQLITDWQISCKVEWDHVEGLPQLGGLPPVGYETGGMSGGPMLTIRERQGILSFPVAGVISEGHSERDVIIADRADFIRADGSIRA